MVERGLGLLGPQAQARLDEHLRGCPYCARTLQVEEGLARDLAALRVEFPSEIDVTAHVLFEIARGPSASRQDVSPRELGWAAGLAIACAVLLLAAAGPLMPQAGSLLADLRLLGVELFDTAGALLRPLAPLAMLPFRLLGAALGYLSDAWPSLARWEPVALAMVSAALTLMTTTIVAVIGRDLLRPAATAGRR